MTMTRDDGDNYTLTVSENELEMLLNGLGWLVSREAVVLRDKLSNEYNDLYREGDE